MTDLDDRLARLGTHLDDERRARRAGSGAATAAITTRHPPPRSRRLVVAGAAAVIALVVAVAVGLGGDDADDLAATGSELPAPAPVPAGAAAPGVVAPYVADPPDWFGDPLDGRRAGGEMTGRWTSAAIGVERGGGRVGSPIWVGVTDGSFRVLDRSEAVVVDGHDYRSVRLGDRQVVASTGRPTVFAGGAVDIGTLASVVRGARTGDTPGGPALELGPLPAGYTLLVPPQRHAKQDPAAGRTLAGTSGRTGVDEVSEWVRPELAASASGADYEQVAVGDADGWTWATGSSRSLVWSPEPGVVLEITTEDPDLAVDDLVDLGRQVDLVPAAEWDDLLSVAAWFDRPLLPSTTATVVAERLDADRVLVTVRFPPRSRLRDRRPACWGLYATPGRDADRIGVLTEPADGGDGTLTPVGPEADVACPIGWRGGPEARFALPLPAGDGPAGLHLCQVDRPRGGCVDVPAGD
jgi:hypothetical protein